MHNLMFVFLLPSFVSNKNIRFMLKNTEYSLKLKPMDHVKILSRAYSLISNNTISVKKQLDKNIWYSGSLDGVKGSFAFGSLVEKDFIGWIKTANSSTFINYDKDGRLKATIVRLARNETILKRKKERNDWKTGKKLKKVCSLHVLVTRKALKLLRKEWAYAKRVWPTFRASIVSLITSTLTYASDQLDDIINLELERLILIDDFYCLNKKFKNSIFCEKSSFAIKSGEYLKKVACDGPSILAASCLGLVIDFSEVNEVKERVLADGFVGAWTGRQNREKNTCSFNTIYVNLRKNDRTIIEFEKLHILTTHLIGKAFGMNDNASLKKNVVKFEEKVKEDIYNGISKFGEWDFHRIRGEIKSICGNGMVGFLSY